MVPLLQVFGDHSRPKSSQQPLLYICAISRQILPRPGAIFSLGYISHLRMLAQLAGTSKRVVVSHPVLNSHGYYTRTLEKTSRSFPACCAIATAERVWPRETKCKVVLMSLWLGPYLGGKPQVAADGQGWVQEQLPSCDTPSYW